MNPIILAGLVKRTYPNFDMSLFDNRLKLQKLIYLIQAGGLNLGYNFRLYLHGPYCSLLAREGFGMSEVSESKTAYFEEKAHEERLKKILSFLEEFKDDADKMEVLASIHLFKKVFPDKSKNEIIGLVEKKDLKFKGEGKMIAELLNKLTKFGLIEW